MRTAYTVPNDWGASCCNGARDAALSNGVTSPNYRNTPWEPSPNTHQSSGTLGFLKHNMNLFGCGCAATIRKLSTTDEGESRDEHFGIEAPLSETGAQTFVEPPRRGRGRDLSKEGKWGWKTAYPWLRAYFTLGYHGVSRAFSR